MLEKQISQVDVIIYVLDARCMKSCLNPEFQKFTQRKPVIFFHSKTDLAPGTGHRNDIVAEIKKLFPVPKKMVRAMVIGVPNSGKSTLINKLANKKKTLTGDKPGITRTKQWVTADDHLWLMDTPGILWPKLENQQIARNLAYIGTIKDDILDIVELSKQLLADLTILGHPAISFEDFGRKRGYLLKGGILDEERCAKAILLDFRHGKMGKYNLDELIDNTE